MMDGWLPVIGIGVGVMSILGPALISVGYRMGTMSSRIEGAHARMDRFEAQMEGAFATGARDSNARLDRFEMQMAAEFAKVRDEFKRLETLLAKKL
jgi:hypothetical protein